MTNAIDHISDHEKLSPTSRRMLDLRDEILAEWERRVRSAFTEAQELRHPVFIDTIPLFYINIVEAVSPDYPRQNALDGTSLAVAHGGERARLTNYNPELLILEYQIFRASILQVLDAHGVALKASELLVINEAIDSAIRESVNAFSSVAAEQREHFIAALTHDIRTPLSTAIMSAQLVERTAGNPATCALAQRIVTNLARVNTMLEGLLDIMVFQHGQRLPLNPTRFDILDMVQEVVKDATGNAQFQIDGGSLHGWWDRDAMKRAFENLISNAVKYGTRDVPIVARIAEEHQNMLLSVHNEGPAIPMEEQAAVFQVFHRSEQAKSSTARGWGVGLPYARAVAESHGGSIIIDSSPELGTTFILNIPLDSRPFQSSPISVPG